MLLFALIIPSTGNAITYDAARDFSFTDNPNGVWSYGWTDATGFHLFTDKREIGPDVVFWTGGDGPLGEPTVGKNDGDNPFIINDTTVYGPGELGLHPGRYGQESVLRWTAPQAGRYLVTAHFRAGDPATTDIQISHGGDVLKTGSINNHLDSVHYSGFINLRPNGFIDFEVGFGSNDTFWFDTTITSVTIDRVPIKTIDPASTFLLLTLGLSSLKIIRSRPGMGSFGGEKDVLG